MKQLGKQYLVGMQDCSPRIISGQDSKSNIAKLLKNTSSKAKAHVEMKDCFESPNTVIAVNVISESHIIFYVDKRNYNGKLHLYTCNQFRSETQNEADAVQYLVTSSEATPLSYSYTSRGIVPDEKQILFSPANLEERLNRNKSNHNHTNIEAYGCDSDILKTVGNIQEVLADAIKADGLIIPNASYF